MCRTSRSGDDHLQAPFDRGAGIVGHIVRGAVGGNHQGFEWHVKLTTNFRRTPHGGPVGVASHDDADEGNGAFCHSFKSEIEFAVLQVLRCSALQAVFRQGR